MLEMDLQSNKDIDGRWRMNLLTALSCPHGNLMSIFSLHCLVHSLEHNSLHKCVQGSGNYIYMNSNEDVSEFGSKNDIYIYI